MRFRSAVVAALVLGVVACDAPVEPVASGEGPFQSPQPEWTASLHQVGGLLATALEDETIRARLRDGLRDSPYNEHKVVLQEFIQTPEARLLRARISRDVGGPGKLEHLLSAIPLMDMYIPFNDQRIRWTPDLPISVAATHDPDASRLTLLGSDRGRRHIAAAAAEDAFPAMLVLHPAEPKHLRVGRLDRTDAITIQDPNEIGLAGAVIRRDSQGNIVSVEEFADRLPPIMVASDDHCDPENEFDPCEPSGGQTCSGVQLDSVMVRFGDGVGSAEVEWTLYDDYHTDPNGGETIRVVNLERNDWKRVSSQCFWSGSVVSPEGGWDEESNLRAFETDAFSDDDWGYGNVSSYDSGTQAPTWTICELVGDPNTQSDPYCQTGDVTHTTSVVISW